MVYKVTSESLLRTQTIGRLMRSDNDAVVLQDELLSLCEWTNERVRTFSIDKCSPFNVAKKTPVSGDLWLGGYFNKARKHANCVIIYFTEPF